MVNIVTDVRFYVKEYVKIGSSPSPHRGGTSESPRMDGQRKGAWGVKVDKGTRAVRSIGDRSRVDYLETYRLQTG